MALAKLTDIQKIARDCYRGNVEQYSKSAANDVLRAAILEKLEESGTILTSKKISGMFMH